MAIIKCLDCGQEISDKAKKCMHCGKILIEEKPNTKKCVECGKESPIGTIECSFCGYPFDEDTAISNVNNKLLNNTAIKIIIPSILIIVIVIIGIIMYNSSTNVASEIGLSTEEQSQINNIKEKISNLENHKTYVQKDLDDLKSEYDSLSDRQKKSVDNYEFLEKIINTPTESEKAAIAVCESIISRLRNPDSLIIEEIYCKEPADGSDYYNFQIDYSAQNGFGGHQRNLVSYSYDRVLESAHGDISSDMVSGIHLKNYLANTNPRIDFDTKRIEKLLNR